MAVPQTYVKPAPSGIPTYDFSDVVTKTGHVTFYGVADTAGDYYLTPVTIESDEEYWETSSSASGGGEIKHNEVDFDVEFKTIQHVNGKLFVAVSYEADGGNGVDSVTHYLKVRIYHYDGSTETEIGTQQTTTTISRSSQANVTYQRELVVFDISRTTFRIGEILRLNIESWGNIGTNCSIAFYHDGKNRDITGTTLLGEAVPTDLKVLVPFEIEV